MAKIDCVGKGWHPIVQPLIDYCAKHNIEVMDVKEKFGSLRFYTNDYTATLLDMITEAEKLSSKTCEECGKPGRIQGKCWVKCVCPDHEYLLGNSAVT